MSHYPLAVTAQRAGDRQSAYLRGRQHKIEDQRIAVNSD